MARDSGAVKVLFFSCAPGVSHPHVVSSTVKLGYPLKLTRKKYGIDLADTSGKLFRFGPTSADLEH